MLKKHIIKTYHIHELPFFKDLPPPLFDAILDEFELKKIECNEVLFREGDHSNDLFLVVSGRLKLIKESEDQKTVAVMGRGAVIGELALLTGLPRSLTVIGIKDSILLKLTHQSYTKLYEEHPKDFYPLIQSSIKRLLSDKKNSSYSKSFFLHFDCDKETAENIKAEFKKTLLNYGTVKFISKEDVALYLSQEASAVDNILLNENPLDVWLAREEIDYDYIFYEAASEINPWTYRALRQSDRVLVFVDAEKGSKLSDEIKTIFAESQKLNKNNDLVLIHKKVNEFPRNTDQWLKQLPEDTKWHHIRLNNFCDMGRVARLIAGRGVSIVLGGGGAPTMVYAGVFKALKEMGCPIDSIGCSCAGSFLAAFLAMDYSIEKMISVSRTSPRRMFHLMDLTIPLLALDAGGKVEKVLHNFYNTLLMEDLWINLFVVATNLTKYRVEVIRKGLLWKAVRATVGIPVVLPPVSNDKGDLLVDGAVVNNLPVDIMRDSSVGGKVIALRLKKEILKPMQLTYERLTFWKLIKLLFRKEISLKNINIFEIIDRASMVASRAHANQMALKADIVIELDVKNVRFFKYDTVEELIDEGYTETMKKKEEILKLVKQEGETPSC